MSVGNGEGQVEYFPTTTDLWSSRAMELYVSLTIHYSGEVFTRIGARRRLFSQRDLAGETLNPGMAGSTRGDESASRQTLAVTSDVVMAASLNKWMRLQCSSHRLHLLLGRQDEQEK